jgi:molecular chaperone GrpE
LQRLQAEFENYRKRMMREQTEIAARAAASLIERLLPVVDNLDRAVAHEDESSGLRLIRKELMDVLAAEGLEEISALGERFDPHLHEAVESHEDANVSDPVCSAVYRSGYKLKGKVLRPAMVGVARPPETHDAGDGADERSSAESTT